MTSERAKGTERERWFRAILTGWRMRAWKPKNAAFRLPGGDPEHQRWISHPQDILGCLDIVAVRADLPVLGLQIGDVTNGAAKRHQIEDALGLHYAPGSRLAACLMLAVALWDPAPRNFRVETLEPRRTVARSGGDRDAYTWLLAGRVTKRGELTAPLGSVLREWAGASA